MILALLHLAAGSAAQVPEPTPVPAAIVSSHVCAAVQLSETHLLARSFVDEMQWLVFTNEELGLQRVKGLGPHGELLLPIVTGAAEGMTLELVADSNSASGTIGVEEMAAGDSIFFASDAESILAWTPRHGGASATRVSTGASGLPTARSIAAPAAHVPVPTPAENRNRNKGRRLRRKKLPPI
ncbi:MAG: hypothetical protein AAGA20_07790 [Planctomycetota bacterium]